MFALFRYYSIFNYATNHDFEIVSSHRYAGSRHCAVVTFVSKGGGNTLDMKATFLAIVCDSCTNDGSLAVRGFAVRIKFSEYDIGNAVMALNSTRNNNNTHTMSESGLKAIQSSMSTG